MFTVFEAQESQEENKLASYAMLGSLFDVLRKLILLNFPQGESLGWRSISAMIISYNVENVIL